MEEVARRQFNIGSCLGRGGFGEVYRAKMASAAGLETDVAVKVLRNDLDPAGQAVQRLRDEGRLLARLNHPTILRVYDLVLLEGHVSLVTEFVDGEDLGACYGTDPIPLRAQLEVIGGVASALDAAWSAVKPDGEPLRLVHRDIKPSNIRISRHGQVKLLDFGIARSDSVEREARTQTNLMVGSPAYMAPERFLDATVHPESDVFALGCCLYEGLAGGERFFHDVSMPIMSGMAVDRKRYDKHLAKRRARIADHTPPAVLELLDALLEYDFEKRPTAADLVHRCEELADQVPGASLGRWARGHGWADGSGEEGSWQGRTITEGTMTRSTFTAPMPQDPSLGTETRWEPTPQGLPRQGVSGSGAQRRITETTETQRGPRIGLAVVLAAVVLGIAVVTVVLAVGGGVVLGGWLKPGEATVVAAAEPPPGDAAEEAEEPVVEAPVEVEAAVEAAPDEPEPAVEPVKAPTPTTATRPARVASPTKPAETKPAEATTTTAKAAEPAPTAPKLPTARVNVDTGGAEVTVVLKRGTKTIALPADVEPGEYEVVETFSGTEPSSRGALLLVSGDTRVISCSARMRSCKIK